MRALFVFLSVIFSMRRFGLQGLICATSGKPSARRLV